MVDREKVIAEFEDIQRTLNEGYGVAITDKSELVRDTLELLKAQETVVHCQECKWYERCELNDLMLNHENGFCSDGEPKNS